LTKSASVLSAANSISGDLQEPSERGEEKGGAELYETIRNKKTPAKIADLN
jgi:hypothetical protein